MTRGLSLLVLAGALGSAAVSALAADGGVVAPNSAGAPAPGRVLVIPVRGPIEPALLYVVRRGAREAAADPSIRAIVFAVDTPGGELSAAEQIIRTIQAIRVPTVAWVERQALSAGALISMAAGRIYMAPGSVIGDALPMLMLPLVGVQELPADLKEKVVSATAAIARAAAEQGGHDPDVAEAMVRIEMELKVGDDLVKPAGRLLTLTATEASRPVGPHGRPLLSAGTVDSLAALLKEIGLEDAAAVEMPVTAAERIARWIKALGWLFLLLGGGGIYLEIKTPGFGLPGIVGILALSLFFWGHHVAGLAGYEDMALIVAGVALLAVELWIPGFGVPGVAGSVLLLAGLVLAMVERPPGGGWLPPLSAFGPAFFNLGLAAAGTIAIGWLAGRWLPRTPAYSALVLTASTSRTRGFTSSTPAANLVGQSGAADSDLRPAGVARIGDRRIDVVTDGEFVPAGTPIRVVRLDGFRIIVEPAAPPATAPSEGSE